jgi:pimeloyl-ACP methyl ester carboxylesterase
MDGVTSNYLVVEGIRTHYLTAGSGPLLVLLHSGEYGACAELSWERNLVALAQHYTVVAPDWLGFGLTDKVFDFGGARERRMHHMRRFLETLDISHAAFAGSSMGGGLLARAATGMHDFPDIDAMILSASGGLAPDNAARRRILDYDCTHENMREIVEVLFHDPRWAADASYVARRHAMSVVPGAWEATAAARFRSPAAPPRKQFGVPDSIRYEEIRCPVLVVAGANDKLREPGYAEEILARLPDGHLAVYDDCGHLPHIEQAAEFNRDVINFLNRALAPPAAVQHQ